MTIKINHEWKHGTLKSDAYCDECNNNIDKGKLCYVNTTLPRLVLCTKCYMESKTHKAQTLLNKLSKHVSAINDTEINTRLLKNVVGAYSHEIQIIEHEIIQGITPNYRIDQLVNCCERSLTRACTLAGLTV